MKQLSLEQFLPYQLSVASDLVSRALSRVYAGYGITIPEWRILAHLSQQVDLTPGELGACTHMDKARVSRALILMDGKGLITRTADTQDKRVAHISLTETGQALFAQIEAAVLEWNQQFRQALPEQDYTGMLNSLQVLRAWCEPQP